MMLKSVRAAAGGAHLLLTLEIREGERVRTERLLVLLSRMGEVPPVGVLSEDTYAALLHEAAVTAAIERGLRLFGAASASRAMLVMKLCRRGVEREIACEAVRELAARGLIDEARGAEAEVKKGIAKHWGDRRIMADLRAKGYGHAALAEAARLLGAENEEHRLLSLLAKKPTPTDAHARARLVASLSRYGYEISMIERLLGDETWS